MLALFSVYKKIVSLLILKQAPSVLDLELIHSAQGVFAALLTLYSVSYDYPTCWVRSLSVDEHSDE